MRLGGCHMDLASTVSMACLTMFVRPSVAHCHANMFEYLLSNERSCSSHCR